MKKISFYTIPAIFGALFLINSAHAFIALSVSAEDINSSSTVYNYEIQTNCIGSCLDTIGGIPVPTLFTADNFYVPYFSDAGISNILSPTGWSSTIESTNDLFGLGSSAGVIHWTASTGSELTLDNSLSGFIYTSSLTGSVKAPFRIQYDYDGRFLDGDPPIPASPLAINAGLVPIATVPVPAAVWLFGSGLLGVLGFKKSKRHLHG
jgi:hypothetical protein